MKPALQIPLPRLLRNLHLKVPKFWRLPRNLRFASHKIQRLLRNLHFKVPKLFACHETCASTPTKFGACYESCAPRSPNSCACHESCASRSAKCCVCHETSAARSTKFRACAPRNLHVKASFAILLTSSLITVTCQKHMKNSEKHVKRERQTHTKTVYLVTPFCKQSWAHLHMDRAAVEELDDFTPWLQDSEACLDRHGLPKASPCLA